MYMTSSRPIRKRAWVASILNLQWFFDKYTLDYKNRHYKIDLFLELGQGHLVTYKKE